MNWALISLVGLIVVVVITNWRNINVGLVGLAMAFLIGLIGGMPLSDIYTSFNTQIFLRMLGMQALIVIARTNGTLDVLGNAVLKVSKGKAFRLLPILLYALIGLGSWLNLGINQVITPFIIALGFQMGFKDPLKLGFCTMFSLFAWGLSPFSMQGQNIIAYAAEQGYTINAWHGGFVYVIVGTCMFFFMYFFYGWHKIEPVVVSGDTQGQKLNMQQILTLVGFAAFIFCNIVLGIDMMVTPIVAAIVLLCLKCADPSKVIKGIPFNTLIMIGGMTVYVGVIKGLGGVEMMSGLIASVAGRHVAPALMALICAIMSVFSSGNGVVIPTMSATVSSLAEAIPGLNVSSMFWAVCLGANASCVSPMSTVGANTLSYYAAAYNPTEEESKKVFNKLLLWAIIFSLWAFLAGLVGLYGIFSD